MTLAVVRNLASARALRTAEEIEVVEQETVDQYALARTAAGLTDGYIGGNRTMVIFFVKYTSGSYSEVVQTPERDPVIGPCDRVSHG
ncbi:hypothetical protein [Streptomyces fildesensis]|uniref:hypothetical protein n=1 Tax=Streptomyces fildesensis TaxID=375757 RepID=UPI0018DFDAEA|nr:hypothetical protein [Streptomyces fildesensis]